MIHATEFTFRGEIACASFLDFARHRANRLDLDLSIGDCSESAVRVLVRGQEALVDMFEMACSLGPYDCIILDVSRAEPLPDASLLQ
jgi:acylphosphatase